jgi:hypothetical protein
MNIVELTRNTATNMQELLLRLADHIAMIEAENAELKAKLEAHNDSTK